MAARSRSVILDAEARYRAPLASVMNRLDQARFVALWNRCLMPSADSNADTVFAIVDAGYGAEQRSYHTRKHIVHCLSRFDMVRELIGRPDAVELGIWFHDVVYVAGAGDNEARSAEMFRQLATGRLPADLVELVCELIIDTLHRHAPRTEEGRYLVDIDLSSFGLRWEEFRRDSDAVREEFAGQSDEDFFGGQVRFLQNLLDRPWFYHTEFFRKYYEQLARSNIRRYLQELKSLNLG